MVPKILTTSEATDTQEASGLRKSLSDFHCCKTAITWFVFLNYFILTTVAAEQ